MNKPKLSLNKVRLKGVDGLPTDINLQILIELEAPRKKTKSLSPNSNNFVGLSKLVNEMFNHAIIETYELVS